MKTLCDIWGRRCDCGGRVLGGHVLPGELMALIGKFAYSFRRLGYDAYVEIDEPYTIEERWIADGKLHKLTHDFGYCDDCKNLICSLGSKYEVHGVQRNTREWYEADARRSQSANRYCGWRCIPGGQWYEGWLDRMNCRHFPHVHLIPRAHRPPYDDVICDA